MDTVTDLDRGIIRNMMLKHSHKEIADLLGYSVPVVNACIQFMITGTAIVTRQMIIDQKKIKQPGKVKSKKAKVKKDADIEKEWKEQKEEKKKNMQHQLEHDRKKLSDAWLARKTFKTLHRDFSKMVSVFIDHKTTIFIKPGEDPAAAKAKFFRNRISQVKAEEIY